jgi:NhaP-type Na+/H+ or K+/H+ antiporter
VKINTEILFYALIPPVLFSDGYNLPKRKFFQNLGYIAVFGILGFLINFLALFGGTYAFSQLGLIYNF